MRSRLFRRLRALCFLPGLVLVGCGSTVEVGAGGGGSTGATAWSGDCVPCRPSSLTPHWEGVPNFCPGEERQKWDALIACACREGTCADGLNECRNDPNGDGPVGPASICDGGEIGGECGLCLKEHCRAEAEACGVTFSD